LKRGEQSVFRDPALRQGTALVVPQMQQKELGFSPGNRMRHETVLALARVGV
jgi:hypothetical protein